MLNQIPEICGTCTSHPSLIREISINAFYGNSCTFIFLVNDVCLSKTVLLLCILRFVQMANMKNYTLACTVTVLQKLIIIPDLCYYK